MHKEAQNAQKTSAIFCAFCASLWQCFFAAQEAGDAE